MLILLSVVSLLAQAAAKTDTGSFRYNLKDWQFVSRFCYRGGRGASFTSLKRKFNFEVDYQAESCQTDLVLALYFDSPWQWASVYKSHLSCEERVKKARGRIPLTTALGTCDYHSVEKTCRCRGARFIEGNRARWWYVAISSCRTEERLKVGSLNYSLQFTNGDHFSDRHFSADEIGISETNIATTIIMVFTFVTTVLYANLLSKRRLYHGTFKLFQVSVFFYLCRCVLMLVYHCTYGIRGHASRIIQQVSQVFELISTSIFLGLLMSFAGGYTIVMSSFTIFGFAALLTFTGLFALCMAASLIWEWCVFDPAAVLYTYQSPPGYFLTAIYFPAWVYFVCQCAYTGMKFKRKRPFYMLLGHFYSVWLLAIPLLILIANRNIVDWERMKTVTICQQIVWLLSYSYLLIVFRPSHTNKHFPFHLRATKVGGSDFEAEGRGQDTNYAAESGTGEKNGDQTESMEVAQNGDQDSGIQSYQQSNELYLDVVHKVPDVFTVSASGT